MSQYIMEMWGKMYGLMDFTLKDLQALPVLDPAPRSKLRTIPEAPQPKEEGWSPMGRRGKIPRELHTASTSQGAATSTLENAQGVKAPSGVWAQARGA